MDPKLCRVVYPNFPIKEENAWNRLYWKLRFVLFLRRSNKSYPLSSRMLSRMEKLKKEKKMKQNQIRPPRSLKPTCTISVCAKSKKRMCNKFTEEKRQCLFDKFWTKLNWDQKKIFVVSHVTRVVLRRKTTVGSSRRSETLNYTLTFSNNKYPVCRKMFLNTLGLGPFTVQSWTKNSIHAMHKCKEAENRSHVKNNPHQMDIDFLTNFFLPSYPNCLHITI